MALFRRIQIRRFLATVYADNLFFLASAIAFDALLAAIPLALLYLAVFGYVVDAQAAARGDLSSVLELILPAATETRGAPLGQIEEMITAVVNSRRELSFYGIPLFLVFSTRLFSSARIALDGVLGVTTKRRWRHDLLYDLLMVIITTAMFTAGSAMTIPAFDSGVINRIAVHALALVFGAILFFAVYYLAPTKKMLWSTAVIAAFVVSVIFELSKILFGTYVVEFVTVSRVISHANAFAMLLFVFWIYFAAMIFLVGAEIAKAREIRLGRVPWEDVQPVSGGHRRGFYSLR